VEGRHGGDGKKVKVTCLPWRPGERIKQEAVWLACCSAGEEGGCSGDI